MQKMRNSVQHYAWGSRSALTERYGIENPDNLPMAELWMGAHPKAALFYWMHTDKPVICAMSSHRINPACWGRPSPRVLVNCLFSSKCYVPNSRFQFRCTRIKRRLRLGLPVKMQPVLALMHQNATIKMLTTSPSWYLAMNGFREFSAIAALLQPLGDAHPAIAAFLHQPQGQTLATLFASLLSMTGAQKAQALAQLKHVTQTSQGEPWETIRFIARYYPDDGGLFSPLLLNVVTLRPGEAMFLRAETPHAYLHGSALEVMANSDNVLRAGLTPKHIDIPELLANVRFEATPAASILTSPARIDDEYHFPIPVDDFAFSLHHLDGTPHRVSEQSATILFCVEGHVLLEQGQQQLSLFAGESCFIPACESSIKIQGNGKVARVYNRPL
ncbi:Mannose-6-phosphate isomerase [Dickeya aquatica]|uniref:mannose-6-phosphate isomerase n=1 Tax=Dickeya aquatica TaxID=1401087 RepID=A0A375AAN3_9GAMM|nr:Mannose-6-phosphate isomerase [Dickeya aquatica]